MAETELTTIARPYARAIFDLALSDDPGLAAWSGALSLLTALVREERLETLLGDPSRSAARKADLLLSVADEELSGEAKNLVLILADNGRLSLLPRISELFETMKTEYEKVVDVEVVTAYDLSSQEREWLTAELGGHLKRDIRLEARTDNNLLGGIIVKTENLVADHSLRGKLARLAQTINA